MSTPLLQVRDVQTHFDIRQKGAFFWQKPATLKAVNGVSFDLKAGETLGVAVANRHWLAPSLAWSKPNQAASYLMVKS